MYSLIQCEFLKLRKSKFYLIIILMTCCYPLLVFFKNISESSLLNWNQYIFSVENMSFIFTFTPIFCLISAYIFSREFSYKTSQILFCYPQSRTKIFISKLITIMVLFAFLLFLELLATILLGFMCPHEVLTSQIIYIHFKLYLYLLFVECTISPICILISLLFKNTVTPLIYGILISVCNLFISTYFVVKNANGGLMKNIIFNIPLFYNVPILYSCFKANNGKAIFIESSSILSLHHIFICILTFIISNLFCILYYKKLEVK
ncbi:ABC transporter permease [Clostridium acetobutylicum]|nr:ABC transporter permease [Clostridium acetobutylicum]